MPRYRIQTIVEHVHEYEFDADSPEDAVALFREGQLQGLGQQLEFVSECAPDLCVQGENQEWVDIRVSQEQWEGDDAPSDSL